MSEIPDREELIIRRIKASIRRDLVHDIRKISTIHKGNPTKATYAQHVYRGSWAAGNKTIIPSLPKLQRSSVIVRYSANRVQGSWKAHGRYLLREHAQEQGKQGVGFNDAHDDIAVDTLLHSWQQAGDIRLWKIIVSPEFAERLDLKLHIRLLVKEMEKTLGTALEWGAVDHYNTDNPHVHLLIRAVKENGAQLLLDREYINEGLRTQSSTIATRQLGYRTQQDIFLTRERQITSERFTQLDNEIRNQSLCAKDGYHFMLTSAIPVKEVDYQARMQLIKRLKKLEAMHIASYKDNLSWHIIADYEVALRQNGIIAGQMKILDRHRQELSDQSQQMVRTTLSKEGERIIGIVLGSGIDPETDNPYLLIEAIDGKAHFLCQSDKIQELRLQDSVKDGHVISIEVKTYVGKNDKVFYQYVENYGTAKAALHNNALLDAVIIDQMTHHHPVQISENKGFAKAFQEAINDRATSLENAQIITKTGNNYYTTSSWKERYQTFRLRELKAALAIPGVLEEWQAPSGAPLCVGKLLHSDSMLTVVQSLDSKYYYFSSPKHNTAQLLPGTEILIEPLPIPPHEIPRRWRCLGK